MTSPAGDDPRLAERLRVALGPHVEGGRVPGLVAAAGPDGAPDPAVVVLGRRALDGPELRRDDLFRVASMTKAVTASVAMMLVEEGVLALDAPVERWLPELADRRVLRSLESELDDTVPAERPITVEDLLSFRMGFGVVLALPRTYPIQVAEEEAGLRTLGPPWPPPPYDADEWLSRLAALPLMAQPGAAWFYNTGIQVLGILLERATGRDLEELFRQRVFGPLGMVDTGFCVPAAAADRLTTAYRPLSRGGTSGLEETDPAGSSQYRTPPPFANAAAGLVSTVDDWWRFSRLLTGGGQVDGARLLAASTVRLMTTDRLTRRQRLGAALFLGPGGGWGLGMRVPAAGVDPADAGLPAEFRGYGWDGGRGTSWRSGVSGHTGILLTQVGMVSPEPPSVFVEFWRAVVGEVDPGGPAGRPAGTPP